MAFDRIQLSTKPEFDGEREDNFDLGRRADLEIIGQGARGRVCEDRRKERKWAGVESAQSATTMMAQEHPIGERREKQSGRSTILRIGHLIWDTAQSGIDAPFTLTRRWVFSVPSLDNC